MNCSSGCTVSTLCVSVVNVLSARDRSVRCRTGWTHMGATRNLALSRLTRACSPPNHCDDGDSCVFRRRLSLRLSGSAPTASSRLAAAGQRHAVNRRGQRRTSGTRLLGAPIGAETRSVQAGGRERREPLARRAGDPSPLMELKASGSTAGLIQAPLAPPTPLAFLPVRAALAGSIGF